MTVAHRERIFLDANVLFSAAIGSKVCRSILGLPGIEVLTSDYCLAEAERNLVAKGYDALTVLAELVEQIDVVATPPQDFWRGLSHLFPSGAVTDLPVLGAALSAKADVLVTGNTRDFGPLMEHGLMKRGLVDGPVVLTPRMFLKRGPRP